MTLRTWIEISKASLLHNITVIKNTLIHNNQSLGVVIKSNAYGHGLLQIASILNNCPDIEWLFTVSLDDAIKLKKQHITKKILVMGYFDQNIEYAALYDIELVVYDIHTAYTINNIGKLLNKRIAVHIKVDCGTSRLGIDVLKAFNDILEITKLPFLSVNGLFTHLSDTNNQDLSFTYEQLALFDQLIAHLREYSIPISYIHVTASGSAVIPKKNSYYTTTRIGTNIYGLYKSPVQKKRFLEKNATPLLPVLSWKSIILQIKQIPTGRPVSYGCTFVTKRPTTIAILPIGYFDGYPSALSNNTQVLIRSHYAPVIGTITMNMIIVDITDIKDVTLSDHVTIIGNNVHINATDLAAKANISNIELLSRINPAIPRLIL